MCCVEYTLCDSLGFKLFAPDPTNKGLVDTNCAMDYLAIEGLTPERCIRNSGATLVNRICGGVFSGVAEAAIDSSSLCGKSHGNKTDDATD